MEMIRKSILVEERSWRAVVSGAKTRVKEYESEPEWKRGRKRVDLN
ncbi:hypothetical protein L195_g049070 [Trifolium pratense]|uniref:Uncharacterized protein n=1 Tax=Trifolium pratense TaxID=57577 RepID=A0A2K3JN22_TRIPR|nr:hypothetical protein L195_g049070 [Trifolium pratense]